MALALSGIALTEGCGQKPLVDAIANRILRGGFYLLISTEQYKTYVPVECLNIKIVR